MVNVEVRILVALNLCGVCVGRCKILTDVLIRMTVRVCPAWLEVNMDVFGVAAVNS